VSSFALLPLRGRAGFFGCFLPFFKETPSHLFRDGRRFFSPESSKKSFYFPKAASAECLRRFSRRLLVAPLNYWKAAMTAVSWANSCSNLSGATAVTTAFRQASSFYVFPRSHGLFTVKIREIWEPTQRPPIFVALESFVARPQSYYRTVGTFFYKVRANRRSKILKLGRWACAPCKAPALRVTSFQSLPFQMF
jgi:hypothetical protein